MDIRINNRDIVILPSGYPETVSGLDEVIQRVRIKLGARKGAFAYDRSLGIDEGSIAANRQNSCSTAESIINEALIGTDVYVKVTGVNTMGGDTVVEFTVSDGYDEKNSEVVL